MDILNFVPSLKIIRVTSASSPVPLSNTRYGFYADGDIGCPIDDYIGTFTDRSATYFYNSNDSDADCAPLLDGYGNNPPAFAIDVFRAGLDEMGVENSIQHTMPIYNSSVGTYPPATTDYNSPAEAYNYLQGKWRDGSPLLNEGLGYSNGEPTDFAFGAYPVSGAGWSEFNADNPGGDRRVMMSSAPFNYFPGAVNEFIIGFTYNDDPSADHTEKVVGLRDNVDLIQSMFNTCFEVNEFSSEFFGCSPLTTNLNELNNTAPLLRMYPNPATNFLKMEFQRLDNGILQVYHSHGQLVMEKEMYNGTHELNIANWPKGVYLLQ